MKKCPRCGKDRLRERAVENATSRLDSSTRICTDCGNSEALSGMSARWDDAVAERKARETFAQRMGGRLR